MARLSLTIGILLFGLADPATAQVGRWRAEIDEASARFGVPAEWIERVMQAESAGRTHQRGKLIMSRAGAMGLMQLMPGTWAELRVRYGLGDNPYDPRANIFGGAAYLRMMHDRFGYPGLFAAYNAGPARYSAYLAGRSSLPRETRNYLALTAGPRWRVSTNVGARSETASSVSAVRPSDAQTPLAPQNGRQLLFAIDHPPAQ